MDVITLYQRDSKEKIRVWSIYVDDNSEDDSPGLRNFGAADMITKTGVLGGQLIESRITFTQGRNIGRSNATTPYQQACLEAQSKAALKRKEGYVERVNELKDSDTLGSGHKAPMLAQKFHPTGAQSSSKTLDQLKLRGRKIGVQRKKDGNRCLVTLSPEGISFASRNGTPLLYDFPALSAELLASYHISGLAAKLRTIILDGELYTNAISFNKLNGILKAKTLKPGYKEALDSVKYHLFDTVGTAGYVERHQWLEAFESHLVHLEAYDIIEATEENLLAKLREFQAEGEEGLMIRILEAPYQHKRTWDLMKYKDDQTEDYVIVGMEEHALGGMVGAIVMQSPPGKVDRDGKVIPTFKAGTTNLSHEESREMWADYLNDVERYLHNQQNHTTIPLKYLNHIATVRFFEFSEYGIPRFPKFLGVRADA